ncbi:MAG: hypothetical protein Q8N18_05310 [Opitutaceae bacterium]|nr:hypothetical protein [Opitutaceae bacterium]
MPVLRSTKAAATAAPKLRPRVMAPALLLSAALAADAPQPWPPPKLSDTGLYRDDATLAVADDVRAFSPQYPLWSDGAAKLRWVALPKGSTIDATDPDAWRFPVGTRFWKQFSFGGRRVETRYIEKTGEQTWLYATYVWSEDQREATLAPAAKGLRNHVEIAPGVRHDIPSVADCRACHEGAGRDAVLGYGALQLSSSRDPLAPHAEPAIAGGLDLDALLNEGRLKNAPDAWRTTPPAIAADSPRARAVLGYLHANCSNCHNDQDPIASVGLSLRASLAAGSGSDQPAMRTAVGVGSKFQLRDVPAGQTLRLAPGDTERSAVLARMRARDGMSQMPPTGSKLPDNAAVQLISDWVREELQRTASATDPLGKL